MDEIINKWDDEYEDNQEGPEPIPEAPAPDAEPKETDINIMPEWSSFDLGASLRALRSSSRTAQNRALRRLHLRFWHASSQRLSALLETAGVSNEVLKLIPAVCDTCSIRRMWANHGHRSILTTRTADRFNLVVQTDLLFIEDHIRWHASDGFVPYPIIGSALSVPWKL